MINPIGSGNNILNTEQAKNKSEEVQTGMFEETLKKAVGEKDEKKLKEACRNFEAVFVNMMFSQMRSTIQKTDLMGGGFAEQTFEDMLYDNYSKEIAKGPGIGLADIMYKQLSKNISVAEEE